MTSPECFGDDERVRRDLAVVDAALDAGRVTADDGADRALQRFALALQAAAPMPSAAFERALDERLAQAWATPAPARRRAGMRIRVLVIDKFPLVREGMASALASDPAIEIVGKAADGTEGLQLARDTTPDVVLLDLDLRDIDGMLVLEGLRQQVPDARVLIVTASENPEGLVAAVGAGAAGYLTKPAGQAELRDAVITVHGGGTVIAPSLAGHLVQRYARASQGDTDALRTALTPRENEVLRLVAQGLTDRQIGEAIFAAPSTVQNHLARIREKTGARSRRALARLFRCFDDADAGCSHKPGS